MPIETAVFAVVVAFGFFYALYQSFKAHRYSMFEDTWSEEVDPL